MKIQLINDWQPKAFGKAFTLVNIGYINVPGLKPGLSFIVLGVGVSINWRRKK